MKRFIAGIILAGAVAAGATGCGSGTCIVLANGGNKLCGADAAAWCESTDGIRSNALSYGANDDISEAQSNCAEIEASN